MATDQIVIDGIDVNDQIAWSILAGSITFTPARKKLNWASSALGDGASLVGNEDHYENAEMVFTVRARQQVNKDAALGLVHTLTQKLQTARSKPGGIPMVWAPVDSAKALTFYIQDAEWDEIHTSKEGGWFDNAPELVCHLYLRPFGYGQEEAAGMGWSDTFKWDGLTGGRWRFDTGSGTIAVDATEGQLEPSTAVEKRLYTPFKIGDSSITMRLKVGATVSGGLVGIVFKRINATNYLKVSYLGGTAWHIRKVATGTEASLTTPALFSYTPTASTFYWLQVSMVGDDITTALYADSQNPLTTDDPTALGAVTGSLSVTEAATFGEGKLGNPGIFLDPPGATIDWFITDYVIRGVTELQSGSPTDDQPLVDLELPDIQGHVPAEGRLVVTEGGAKDQAHFEWGMESREYDSEINPPLILDSGVLVTTGLAGAQAVGTNMYDPVTESPTNYNQILSQPLSSTAAVAVCSTGSQKHTGSYKVKARVKGAVGVRLRLAWQAGVTPLVRNAFTDGILGVSNQEVDLGTVTIPVTGAGTQHWLGRIEAYSPETPEGTLQIDYLLLIPVERYGVARAPIQPVIPDVFVARDGFNQGSATMQAATLDVGGAWATSGATGDFSINTTSDYAQRSVLTDGSLNTPRYAIAGTTDYAAVQVQADCKMSATIASGAAVLRMGVLARYVDANNWLAAVLQVYPTAIRVFKKSTASGATPVELGSLVVSNATQVESRTIVLRVDVDGTWSVWRYKAGTNQPVTPPLQGEDAVLSTGQGLAEGRIGIIDADAGSTAVTRIWDNFSAFSPAAQQVIYASKTLEVRSDSAEREYIGGNLWGRVPQYRGDRFFVPPTSNGNISRLACKARRLNIDQGQPDGTALDDSITVSVHTTPRYLHPVGQGN